MQMSPSVSLSSDRSSPAVRRRAACSRLSHKTASHGSWAWRCCADRCMARREPGMPWSGAATRTRPASAGPASHRRLAVTSAESSGPVPRWCTASVATGRWQCTGRKK